MKVQIEFDDKNFFKALKEKEKMFGIGSEAQKFVDNEVLKLMVPYTPMRTGAMMMSAVSGTVIGSGKIQYNSPYARYLYYGVIYGPKTPIVENGKTIGFSSPPKKEPTGREMKYSKEMHPLAGKLWFERMKADHKDNILKGAMAVAMGRKPT